MKHELPVYVPILALFAIYFSLIPVMARLSGWKRVAKAYPALPVPPSAPKKVSMGTMYFRRIFRYRQCLVIESDDSYLYIRMWALFRFAHPPIAVPWREITCTPRTLFFVDMMMLEFAAIPGLKVDMRIGQFEKLAWPKLR